MPSEERRSAISSQRGAPKRDQHAERGAPERDQLAARSDKARSTRVEMAGAAPHTRVSSDGGGPHQLKDEERSGNANSSARSRLRVTVSPSQKVRKARVQTLGGKGGPRVGLNAKWLHRPLICNRVSQLPVLSSLLSRILVILWCAD